MPRGSAVDFAIPSDTARFTYGAARSPGRGQGDRADRRRHRPRILGGAAARGGGPSAARLDDDLAQLASSGLIFQQPSPSGRIFCFKHGLVRDVAYQSLLKGRRQQIHGAIASAIREAFPAMEQNHPELVARHLTEAGVILPALGYWFKAGMLAISRSAYREAVAHLEHGLELVPALRPRRKDNAGSGGCWP